MVSRAEPSCSRRTRTGRSASPAGRGPRAASSSSSTCRGPRSSTTSSAPCREVLAQRPDLVRQVGHEPDHHRAVQRRPPGRPPGRVLPPLHPRRLRPVRRLTARLPGRSCSSRARAAAAGSTRACSRSRRRPGRATTPTPSSGCAIQWGTSLAYPLSSMGAHVVGRPEPPDRPDHADRDAGRRRVLRRASATSSTRPRWPPTTGARSPTRSPSTSAHRELFQRGRFVRLRSPFEGDGNQTAWMVVAPDRVAGDRRAATRSSTGRSRPPTACGCAASIRRRVYRVTGWPDVDDRARPRQRRRARRRRADGRRPVARRRPPRGRRSGATSGPGCSCSRPSRRGPARLNRFRGASRHPFTDLIGPHRTDLDHTRPTRRSTCGPRGDDAQSRYACASEMGHERCSAGWIV